MQKLNAAEHAALNWIHQLAAVNRANLTADSEAARWRHSSVAELLLEHGRLFTPSAPTTTGPAKACYRNASEHADTHPDIYVEGLASTTTTPWLALEHAWCATGHHATDPTWSDGAAYIGIPLTDNFRRHRQNHTQRWALLWSSTVMDLLRDGLPPSALAEAGRPIPTELSHPQT